MPFEIKTPDLKKSVELAEAAARGLKDGSLTPQAAEKMLKAARALQKAVALDLKKRIRVGRT